LLDYFEGILKISNVVLAIIAGYIALTLFKISHEKKELRPWKALIVALIFFMIQEILGALRAFGIFESPYLTHVIPTLVLIFIIYALAWQIHIHITEK
jgi:uncharacterized membrane protein